MPVLAVKKEVGTEESKSKKEERVGEGVGGSL